MASDSNLQSIASDSNLLTYEQIEAEYQISRGNIRALWMKKRLHRKKVLYPSGAHAVHRDLFQRTEIESLLKPLPALDSPYKDDGGTWFSVRAAACEYGTAKVPAPTLGRWYRDGRLKRTDDRPVAQRIAMRVGDGSGQCRVTVFHQEAVESFIAERQRRELPDRSQWTPTADAKWSPGILNKWAGKNGCPILGGQRLRRKKVPLYLTTSRGQRMVGHSFWDREQLDRIESKLLHNIKDPYRDDRGEWWPIVLAAKRSGVPKTSIYRWSQEGYCAMNGDKLDVRSQELYLRLSLNRYRRVRVFHAADLLAAKRAADDWRRQTPPAPDGFMTAAQAEEMGILPRELSVYALRGCVFLDGKKLHRETYRGSWRGGAGRNKRPTWQYSRPQILQIVAARYPERRAPPAPAAVKPPPKHDNKHDNRKKYLRPLTDDARDCIARYSRELQSGEKPTMKSIAEQWVTDKGGSVSSLMRTLNDHASQWKRGRPKDDKKDDNRV